MQYAFSITISYARKVKKITILSGQILVLSFFFNIGIGVCIHAYLIEIDNEDEIKTRLL